MTPTRRRGTFSSGTGGLGNGTGAGGGGGLGSAGCVTADGKDGKSDAGVVDAKPIFNGRCSGVGKKSGRCGVGGLKIGNSAGSDGLSFPGIVIIGGCRGVGRWMLEVGG